MAQTIVNYFYDSLEFDDAIICLSQGYYRQANSEKLKPFEDISLIPNPANEKVEIRFLNKTSEMTKIIISSTLGLQIDILSVSHKNSFVIDTKNSSPGIYFIEVFNNNEKIGTKMLILVR